jgi:hypothetical protein
MHNHRKGDRSIVDNRVFIRFPLLLFVEGISDLRMGQAACPHTDCRTHGRSCVHNEEGKRGKETNESATAEMHMQGRLNW